MQNKKLVICPKDGKECYLYYEIKNVKSLSDTSPKYIRGLCKGCSNRSHSFIDNICTNCKNSN